MENDLIAPKPTNTDSINTALKVLISPFINGTAMEILNAITVAPIERRRNKFFEDICSHIKTLESEIEELKPERLSQNELFITVLLKSLQAIIKEHQKEKIDAFKNAVINTVTIESISEDYKLLFLSYLESFTVVQIQIIKFFHDEFYIKHDEGGIVTNLGIKFNLFSKFNDDIKIENWTFLHIVRELDEKGLIISNRPDGQIPIADMFIAFISGHFK